MLIPGIIVVLIYAYGPMFGLVMAFEQFNPFKGFFRSKWIGLENFKYVFAMHDFTQALTNTLIISIFKVILGIIAPLIMALLINELMSKRFAKLVQSSLFLPYFISWAVLGGIFIELLSIHGPINELLGSIGIEPITFLLSNTWFRPVIVLTDTWKNLGYYMIVYLAAITSIDTSLYEAAEVDGAGRWKQAWHITIPGILPMIILTTTLSIGQLLNSANFEQIYMLYNPAIYQTGDIIDTLVFRMGINNLQYAPAAVIGFFKSTVSFFLVTVSYYCAYKFSDYRIF